MGNRETSRQVRVSLFTDFSVAEKNCNIMLDVLKAVILGLVEGVTEFLPISSTGHLIVAADLLEFSGRVAPTFEIFIQLGAVLAVMWFYRHDLLGQLRALPSDKATQRLWFNLFVAFLPAAGVGLLLHKWIKAVLFSPGTVATVLIVGGFVLLFIEWRPHAAKVHHLSAISLRQAIVVGLAQVASLIPGVSRSAATIIGGLLAGLDRETATGFSFYLAIPTLGSATVYDLLANLGTLGVNDLLILMTGLLTAFVTAFVVIGWLLRYVANHDLRVFGFYRVAVGFVILLWMWRG